MKADLTFNQVQNVYIAIIQEWNDEYSSNDWNVYLVNANKFPLEQVMVMSRGRHEDGRKTTTFRHAFMVVPAREAVKLELIMEHTFNLTHEFILTFFHENKMYDHVFSIAPNKINEGNFVKIPVLNSNGIILQP